MASSTSSSDNSGGLEYGPATREEQCENNLINFHIDHPPSNLTSSGNIFF